MKILMMTNTYTPFVGGVPKSVQTFTNFYRKRGHRVVVVAPDFDDAPEDEEDVIRVPAIKNFQGTGFSVRIPIPGVLRSKLDDFEPDLVHAHHPFLIGDTAIRVAREYNLPSVFTHHTMYEKYTHYLPVDVSAVKKYAVQLATGYANFCDLVFAPSGSVRDILLDRGVETPIEVIPTGVDVAEFEDGDGTRLREENQIPEESFLVGHLGRLAPEKNLPFLTDSVLPFVKRNEDAHFLVVGDGPSREEIEERFSEAGLEDRLHLAGVLGGQELVDAYHSMDLFAFASQTETQGMVLVEAMAAGVPVLAVDAPGARDVVTDGTNGRLIEEENQEDFTKALDWFYSLNPERKQSLIEGAHVKAYEFSQGYCSSRALEEYAVLRADFEAGRERDEAPWSQAMRRLEAEWDILGKFLTATDAISLEDILTFDASD